MTSNSYIGFDKRRYRNVARRRIGKKLPINMDQFISLVRDDLDSKTKYVELPLWLERHNFDTEGMYPLKWWKNVITEIKKELQ